MSNEGVVLSADTDPEEILSLLNVMKNDGLIDYVLPTIPLGGAWVIGMAGQISNFSPSEVAAFLIGHQQTLHWLMDQVQSHGMHVAAPWAAR